MLFNAKNDLDVKRALSRLNFLITNQKEFELVERKPVRSIPQNSYLHLIFSWFAIQTGYTLEEVKQDIFKKIVNPTIFYEGEFGGLVKIERWRSTADLTTDEMTVAIERFRDYSAQQAGIYLPEPKDLAFLKEIKNEIGKIKNMIYV